MMTSTYENPQRQKSETTPWCSLREFVAGLHVILTNE